MALMQTARGGAFGITRRGARPAPTALADAARRIVLRVNGTPDGMTAEEGARMRRTLDEQARRIGDFVTDGVQVFRGR